MATVPMFREEAVSYSRGRRNADVLRIAAGWTRWAYWLLVAAFAVALLFIAFGKVHEYARGPAVVWMSGATQITAATGGTVADIEVLPGQSVAAGQVLVRFTSSVESAELARIDREFEVQLANTLRDPSDQGARASVAELRTQREVAAAKVDLLTIRAPKEGVIGDMRIRRGELIETGRVVLTLLGRARDCSVMVMLPAQYRPQLAPGSSMRFEVTGYRFAYQEMTVRRVGTQIIGPSEVKRYLGQEIEDTVTLTGPLVLVEAVPASPTFTVDGQRFDFYHGMSGVAEVRVRTESILLALVPSLRALVRGSLG